MSLIHSTPRRKPLNGYCTGGDYTKFFDSVYQMLSANSAKWSLKVEKPNTTQYVTILDGLTSNLLRLKLYLSSVISAVWFLCTKKTTGVSVCRNKLPTVRLAESCVLNTLDLTIRVLSTICLSTF